MVRAAGASLSTLEKKKPLTSFTTTNVLTESTFNEFLQRDIHVEPQTLVDLLEEATKTKDLPYFAYLLSLTRTNLPTDQAFYLLEGTIVRAKDEMFSPFLPFVKSMHPEIDPYNLLTIFARTATRLVKIKRDTELVVGSLTKIRGNLLKASEDNSLVEVATKQLTLAENIAQSSHEMLMNIRILSKALKEGRVLTTKELDKVERGSMYVPTFRKIANEMVDRFVHQYQNCLRNWLQRDCEKRIIELYGFEHALSLPKKEEAYTRVPVPFKYHSASSTDIPRKDWRSLNPDIGTKPMRKLTLKEEIQQRSQEVEDYLSGGSKLKIAITSPKKITEGDLEE